MFSKNYISRDFFLASVKKNKLTVSNLQFAKVKNSLHFFAYCLLPTFSFAQLQVTPNNNPTQLAQTLAGPGVTVSGATMNCPSNSTPANNPSGTFVGTSSNIGIAGGILLTTGDVQWAVGPNNSPSAGISNNSTFNDPDLMTIDPQAINDVCILEFNAVPTCDTLQFTFAFGSEEYPEFVNSSFNDAFGIFVTGVNPSGPNYTGYNMARIPVSLVPVSINNVNNGNYSCTGPPTGPCTNCAYYVDNCSGTTVQYDGFTTPITVKLNVVPCGSYHFKLAIADAGDHIFDSGVFFALQSLSCNTTLTIQTQTTPAICTTPNGTAAVTNVIGGVSPYTYTWNTTPPQNTQTATGLAPGNYTVTVVDANGCISGTQTVTIINTGGFTVTPTSSNVNCFGGNNGSASVTPTGGTAPYTYSWNTTPVQTTPSVSNIPAGNYTVNITDATGCVQTQTFAITQPAVLTATASVTNNVSCNGLSNGSAAASSSGGTSPYSYWWTPSGQTNQTVSGLIAGTYSAVVTDSKGCTAFAPVTITQPAAISVAINSTPTACGIKTGTASVNFISGGTPPYFYQWQTSPVQTTSTAVGLGAGNYVVIIVDSKGCPLSQTASISSLSPPGANFNYDPIEISMLDPMTVFFDASAGNIISWYWDFNDPSSGQNNFSGLQNPTHTFSDTGNFCVQLVITDTAGVCKDSIVKCLRVEAPFTLYIPNSFSPNSDGLNDFFTAYGTFIKEFKFWIYDRWGNLIWNCESNGDPQLSSSCKWDGKVKRNGDVVQEDVYVWKAFIVDIYGRKQDFKGHLTVVK